MLCFLLFLAALTLIGKIPDLLGARVKLAQLLLGVCFASDCLGRSIMDLSRVADKFFYILRADFLPLVPCLLLAVDVDHFADAHDERRHGRRDGQAHGERYCS